MKFGPMRTTDAIGQILAHAVFLPGRKLPKGTLLSAKDISEMAAVDIAEVITAQLESDDVDEDRAAQRIADALLGPGTRSAVAATGRCNVFAMRNGLFDVNVEAIDAVNAMDEAVTIATLPKFRPVYAGEMLATVKIIPYSVSFLTLARVEQRLSQVDVTKVLAFQRKNIVVISTVLPRTKVSVIDKTLHNLDKKLAIAGAKVCSEMRVSHHVPTLALALADQAARSDLIVIFGAAATSDRLDVIPAAIVEAGGVVEHFGMPVDPGNLLVLGNVGGKPVIGAPGCARSAKENGFDWVLQRLLAGITLTKGDIQRMGVGGLLMEIPSRPQRRVPIQALPKMAAIVLAAGRGSRIGGHKMSIPIAGRPMLTHAVDLAIASALRPIIVVVGQDADESRRMLGDRSVLYVKNDAVDLGISNSLKLGLQAVPGNCAGALILLGDMPAVTLETLEALRREAALESTCKAVVPVFDGRRGNPVLLMRRFFDAACMLKGDQGARNLLSGADIIDLPVTDPGILIDIDTPEDRATHEATHF